MTSQMKLFDPVLVPARKPEQFPAFFSLKNKSSGIRITPGKSGTYI